MKIKPDFVQFADAFPINISEHRISICTNSFQRFDQELWFADIALATRGVAVQDNKVLKVTPFAINRNVCDRNESPVTHEQVVDFVRSNSGYFMGTLGLISTFYLHKEKMRKTGMRFISPEVLERLPIVRRPSICEKAICEIPYILAAEWGEFQYGSIQTEQGLDGHCVVLLFQRA
jgi:hypothetical protein